MTWRFRPRNSQTQTIHALLVQRRASSVRVAGSWMMPRLPMNRPRCSMATISPKGVTRFCSGMGFAAFLRASWTAVHSGGAMSESTENSRRDLAPWLKADLPEPPMPRGLQWIGVCGPGIIVLGVSIGSGEFLLGPATFVRHGLSLLWVTLVAVFFQTVFNTELMRYTVATGEPAVTGFMRTRPGKTFWAWFYAILYFLQIGWPAWAATAAGAVFFLFLGRLATPPADSNTIYLIGIATFLACVGVLLLGKRIARTLELLNWVLVTCILGGFVVLGLIFVPANTWSAALVGFVGFDAAHGKFSFLPDNLDILLLGALVGYSGGGGVLNITLS